MGYQEALTAAGATVHAYEEFGSYQGHWIAKVTWKGVTGWIYDYYGSCSGCDSYQAEFMYDEDKCEEHRYKDGVVCNACNQVAKKLKQKLADFGKRYLDDMLLTQEEIEKKCKEGEAYHDDEDRRMLTWVQENKI